MIKHIFASILLLSIAVCSFATPAFCQQKFSDDPFGAPAAGGDAASSSAKDDLFGEPEGQAQPKNAGAGKEFALDGVLLTASRVRTFTVSVSTLQIQPSSPSGRGGGMGGMMGGDMEGMEGMGGYGGMGEGDSGGGGGYGGGMSPGGMGSGGMGGMSGSGMAGMGGMSGMGMGGSGMGMGSGTGGMSDMRVVVAFIIDEEKIAGRTRIEVLAPQGTKGNYVRLEALSGVRSSKAKADKKAPPLWSPAAAKLIKDTISLKIWKEDAINTLKSEEGKGEQAAASEKLLKAVLSEEYDTQLERQHFELVRLEERLKRIQDEFTRRKQAKDRVIDVQLGKIILEAQGILGDNQ